MGRLLALVLFSCLTSYLCAASNAILSENGKHAEEETVDRITERVLLFRGLLFNETEDSSSSGENETSKEVKKSKDSSDSSSSSESLNLSENSSSSESTDPENIKEIQRKKLVKRSLDTKPESVNLIGTNSSQTDTKANNNLDTTSVSQPTTTVKTSEDKDEITHVLTNEQIETTTLQEETTTELKSEVTTDSNEAETTTEAENKFTTEEQSETTTVVDNVSTEGENVEEGSTTTESESETTTIVDDSEGLDINAAEKETNLTTEAEPTTPEIEISSEGSEELPYYSPSSTTSEVPSTTTESHPQTMMEIAMDRVNKLSDQIRLILTTYKQVGVVVVPGQSFFPEPMTMQDFRQSFSIGTMDFKNMRVYGLSKFTVEHINTDVDRMQVYILLHMKKLVILGNYTLRTFFSRAAGPFNVTLLNVDSEGVAEIQSAPEGYLEAADSEMDMFTKDMLVDFKNLGFMGSMFQGMVSAVGDALFNSIKPQILERVNLVIRTDVNKKLKEFSTKFINKVNPVDLAFSEGRRYCRNQGYDPYHINDHSFILGGLVYVNITEFWVEGLSRFHRVGNLSLSMDAGVIEIGVHVITGKLTGHCHWSGQTFGIAKQGKTNFTVDHLQVRAMVHQSLDVRKKPKLNDLDLELGYVRVSMDSPMTLSMMVEGIINAFPKLIRHIIVDALEQPLKEKIQEILNKINVEVIVNENLPRLDSFGL